MTAKACELCELDKPDLDVSNLVIRLEEAEEEAAVSTTRFKPAADLSSPVMLGDVLDD